MKFKSLNNLQVFENEREIRQKWLKEDILSKTIENRKGFVFYDGPIYANAKPGIHHVLAKTIKDSFCKYKTMQGYRVLRKIGLDTHGLPIEVNVEKKLGFKSKADIEAFGVENFCRQCNNATADNIDEVNALTDMMGQFIDCKNPYITCSNEYIESEWWLLKEIDKKGLLYYGNKVLWYCPRCGTELSQNEVSQGYQETSVNSLIVPFKKKDEDVYFLVWTTTPWTLMANVALCVNPNLDYVKVESQGYKFILAESLLEKVLGEDVNILDTYKGSDLVGLKYEQLMPFVDITGKAFEVVSDNYVSATDGTGIVHIAPAFGADDNRVCEENGITFVNPVGPDGCYTEGPWKDRHVPVREEAPQEEGKDHQGQPEGRCRQGRQAGRQQLQEGQEREEGSAPVPGTGPGEGPETFARRRPLQACNDRRGAGGDAEGNPEAGQRDLRQDERQQEEQLRSQVQEGEERAGGGQVP